MSETGPLKFTSPQEVIDYCQSEGIRIADLKFIDLPGTWQHLSIPVTELDVDAFEKASALMGPASAGSSTSMKAICCSVPTQPLPLWTLQRISRPSVLSVPSRTR